MKWKHSKFLENYEVRDFENCYSNVTYGYCFPPFEIFEPINNNTEIVSSGFLLDALNLFSQKYNLTFQYTFHSSAIYKSEGYTHDIFLDTSAEQDEAADFTATSYFFIDHVSFYVTKGFFYTSFEKFILPFDLATWMCILLSVVASFLTIFFVYLLPLNFQKRVFGDYHKNASLNLTQIFFGIGVVHIPKRDIARFLFMMLTIYCLIIRSAYQSKMYEFIYEDVRKPTAKTIEDLIRMKIPIIIDSEAYYADFAEE